MFTYSLEEINFGDCLLKTRGAVILGEALKDEHFALEQLILDHNEIRADGGYSIASAMLNKEQLTLLDLDGNQVSQFDFGRSYHMNFMRLFVHFCCLLTVWSRRNR